MSRSSRFFAHRKFDPAIMGEPLVTGCYASRSRWLRFAARHLNDQRPSGSTSWIFREHSDEMTGNILARQWHPRLGTSTDEAIRIPILIVALQLTVFDPGGLI